MLANLTAQGAANPAYAPFAGIIIPQGLIGLIERPVSATPVTFVKAHQISSDSVIGLKLGSMQALIADPCDWPMMLMFELFFRFILISVTEMIKPLLQSSSTAKGSVMLLPVIFAES